MTKKPSKQKNRAKPLSLVLRLVTWAAALVTIGTFLMLVGYILVKGLPNLGSEGLFSMQYTSTNGSLMPALINTVLVVVLTLAMAVPLGVFAAIYLVEYARRGSGFVRWVGLAAETLSGIPSIVYGLFGLLLFVEALGWGYTDLAGACTLAIMVLPVVMRTTQEALESVPDSYREGSYGLGAGRLRTVYKVVLPAAAPGILAGVILSVGRIVGETAALMYTAGTMPQIPTSVMTSSRTLAVHMYALANEGLHIDKAYATAVVLLLVVVIINTLSAAIAKKIGKGSSNG